MPITLDETGQDWRVWATLYPEGGSPKRESDVTSGYWRRVSSKGFATPVATYFVGDMIHAKIGNGNPIHCESGADWFNFETTTWPQLNAVDDADYDKALETGFWPDALAIEQRQAIGGNNSPEDAIVLMLKQAEQEIEKAEALVKAGAAKTKAKSDAAANTQSALIKLKSDLDEKREVEKKPHKDAADAVDARFMPLIKKLNTLANARSGEIKMKVINPFLAEKERVAAEAQRAAQAVIDAENERLRKIEEAERAAAAPEGEKPEPITDEQWQEAAPSVTVTSGKISAGAKGAKVSLRDVRYGEIVDYPAFCAQLVELNNRELLDLLTTLGNRLARHAFQAELKHGEQIIPGLNMKIVRE